MSNNWTPLSLIQWTAGFFEKKGIPNPRLDAELLLAHVLKCKRIDLYMQFEKIVSEQDRATYKSLIERRATREPLQYIMGETEFWGLTIKVTPDVLIPRSETELLVEHVLNCVKERRGSFDDSPRSPDSQQPLKNNQDQGVSGEEYILSPIQDEYLALPVRVELTAGNDLAALEQDQLPVSAKDPLLSLTILEIGTGSGCISIALAKNLPQAHIIATDISPKALEVARKNIRHHALDTRIQLVESNLAPWEDFQKKNLQFDLIVSNPPYIPAAEIPTIQPEVSQHEPHLALSGGESGLDIIEKIHEHVIPFLKPQAFLMMEIGEGQAKVLKEKYENHPTLPYLESIKDYQGIERIVCFKKS